MNRDFSSQEKKQGDRASHVLHETFERNEAVAGSSDKAFGLTFAAIGTIVGLLPLLHGGPVRLWAIGAAVLFLAPAIFLPQALAPLNRLWLRIGLTLHRIVNPLALGIMFYLFLTPLAVVMRLFGTRFLSLGFDPRARSYWIRRDLPGPKPETLRRQF